MRKNRHKLGVILSPQAKNLVQRLRYCTPMDEILHFVQDDTIIVST